jgi:hypothetical protein
VVGHRDPHALVLVDLDVDQVARPVRREAGEEQMVSITDDLGNDDRALTLGYRGHSARTPIWSPAADAIYFGVYGFAVHSDEAKKIEGVFRYDMATGQVRQLWVADHGTWVDGVWSLALSPDGNSMVAAGQSIAYLVEDLLGPSPRHRIVLDHKTAAGRPLGGLQGVAWAPSAFFYLELEDRDDPRIPRGRIARVRPDNLQIEPKFIESEPGELVRCPLPLADGRVMLGHTAGPSIMVADAAGVVSDLGILGYCPVALDPAANVLFYLDRHNLHRRNLTTGTDLVIVQSVESASLSR